MKIGIGYLQSMNADMEDRDVLNRNYLEELSRRCGHTLEIVQPEALKEEAMTVVFVGGGGTEGRFLKLEPYLKEPIFLLTSGENNSLAASMEILSYLRQKGVQAEILHGDLDDMAARLSDLVQVFKVEKELQGLRLGSVGDPSDWLISSHVDADQVREKTGIELVSISMEEFFAEIEKHQVEENEYTRLLRSQAWPQAEMQKSLEIYGALKRLCQKYQLNGVTVRCFDLLGPVKSTGCLALAILNAEGIYGGCEGDMPSLIAMTLIGKLTDQPVFMCNPSRILSQPKQIIFAHCTLPLTMPSAFRLMTHFESDLGVALAGHLREGEATVFKCSSLMDRYFVQDGEIVENLNEKHLCRTQIRVSLPQGLETLLKEPIGNHHLIVLGHYASRVQEFFRFYH